MGGYIYPQFDLLMKGYSRPLDIFAMFRSRILLFWITQRDAIRLGLVVHFSWSVLSISWWVAGGWIHAWLDLRRWTHIRLLEVLFFQSFSLLGRDGYLWFACGTFWAAPTWFSLYWIGMSTLEREKVHCRQNCAERSLLTLYSFFWEDSNIVKYY